MVNLYYYGFTCFSWNSQRKLNLKIWKKTSKCVLVTWKWDEARMGRHEGVQKNDYTPDQISGGTWGKMEHRRKIVFWAEIWHSCLGNFIIYFYYGGPFYPTGPSCPRFHRYFIIIYDRYSNGFTDVKIFFQKPFFWTSPCPSLFASFKRKKYKKFKLMKQL